MMAAPRTLSTQGLSYRSLGDIFEMRLAAGSNTQRAPSFSKLLYTLLCQTIIYLTWSLIHPDNFSKYLEVLVLLRYQSLKKINYQSFIQIYTSKAGNKPNFWSLDLDCSHLSICENKQQFFRFKLPTV